MRTYHILVNGRRQHTVVAANTDEALERWCDEQGYDSLSHAADEYYCDEADITAVRSD